jgi:hypothetical protein
MACRDLAFGKLEGLAIRVLPAGAGNAVKDSWGRFSLHVAVRSEAVKKLVFEQSPKSNMLKRFC